MLQKGGLIQFGRPEEVYTRPASPFVARFTGLAGELPVRVTGRVPGPEAHRPRRQLVQRRRTSRQRAWRQRRS